MAILASTPTVVPATSEKTYDTVWYNNINIQAFDMSASGKARAICTVSKVALKADNSGYERAPQGAVKAGGTFIIDDVMGVGMMTKYASLPVTLITPDGPITGMQAVIAALLLIIKAEGESKNVI